MNNWVRMPLNAVPPEWRGVLEEYNLNFTARWNGLISDRQDAVVSRDQSRIEEIDSEICQMMAGNNSELGQRNCVGKIVGGPGGFAILPEEFFHACS